jgi:hypothetical protein
MGSWIPTSRSALAWPIALVALAAAALLADPASAQLRLVPQVGLYAPASELPSLDDAREFGKRESSLAYGLALELGPGLRLAVLHGSEGSIPISGVGCVDCDARSTVTSATATLVVRPLPEIAFLQPFVLLGGGVKRYDFTREDLEDEGLRRVLTDTNDATAHLGLGVQIALGGFTALVELQDLVSNFSAEGVDSRFQHDLFLTLGLALGR